MRNENSMKRRENALAQTFHYAELGLPYKVHAIKGLVVCNSLDLEPLDLLNALAIGFYESYKSCYKKGNVHLDREKNIWRHRKYPGVAHLEMKND